MNDFRLLRTSSLLVSLALAACGGSSGQSSEDAALSTPAPTAPSAPVDTSSSLQTGQLAGVQGIRYETASTSGYTSDRGQFRYRSGETVQFFVGDILVGSARGGAVLSLVDLAGGNSDQAQNIARFLLTLDYDQAPANGVMITTSIHSAARGVTLDFAQSPAAFAIAAETILGTTLASTDHVTVFEHSVREILPKAYAQQSTLLAQKSLARYTYPVTTPLQRAAFPDIETEAAAVFDLMLQNTVKANASPLEFIFSATNTPLVLEPSASGSLLDMYVMYKQRVAQIGPDAPHVERTDFVSASAGDWQRVQHFAVMSDFQMRDEESPLNVNLIKFLIPAAYYPASAHITYQVDDMVRTLRSYEDNTGVPVEMAVFTGDFADISQYNEVRHGIDVLDGNWVNPDTGIDDDPIPGTFNDGKPNDTYDGFQALGLNGVGEQASIPWYYVPGNHDGLVLGNIPITDAPLNLFGRQIRGGTREFFDNIATGNVNWLGYSPSLAGFLQHLFDAQSFYIAPDEDRRVVNAEEIASEMFNSTSLPAGHGMQHVIDQHGTLGARQHYQFTSENGLIRHLALDTNSTLGPEGWLTLQDIAWLKRELDAAVAEGQLVIVSSHHRPDNIIMNGLLLVDTLNQYPNVIAHLVAHTHYQKIRPRPGVDAAHSYWEIESGSMVNWPQQFRMLDVQVNADTGTGMIVSTMLNHETDSPLHISNRGRFLSYVETVLEASFSGEDALVNAEGTPQDRNARLYFVVPPAVLARL